ncbi:MAG: hypothetical protein AB1473_13695 [Thermodesulfobacteriota bacterium]
MIRLADIKIDPDRAPQIDEKEVRELMERVASGDPEATTDYQLNFRALGQLRLTNRTRGSELLGVRSAVNGGWIPFNLGPSQGMAIYQSSAVLAQFIVPPQTPHNDPPVMVENLSTAMYIEAFLTHAGSATTHEQLIFPAGGAGSSHLYWMNIGEILFLMPLGVVPFMMRLTQLPAVMRVLF